MMKKRLFISILFSLLAISVMAQTAPTLKFDKNPYDFGVINKKERPYIDVYFKFTNTDATPILLFKTTVPCGCMTTYYSNKPILKGETGTIRVRIDTRKQEGKFFKNIVVKSNAKNDLELLKISGTIY